MNVALLTVAVVLLLAYPLAAGQGRAITSDIAGTVINHEGVTVADATITALNLDTQLRRAATSATTGRFDIPALPPGRYRVEVERPGFLPLALENLRLTVGERIDVEFALTPSTFATSISVVGESAAAALERNAASAVIPQELIEQLPTNGRNFVRFAVLAHGVSTDQTPGQGASRTSGLTFTGQRARSNNITVDGLDNNDETVGSVRALFSQEAVQEFQVLSGLATAEFGKASGGFVNVVTRSGGNALSGNVFGFFRDRALNSKGYFERFAPSGERLEQPKATFSQKQFGATLGGPLRRNSTFFFLSFERSDLRAGNFVTIDDRTPVRHPLNPAVSLGTPADILRNAGFPVDTGNVPYTMSLSQFLAKIDRQGAAHTIGIRMNAATELNENIEPFGGQVARSRGAALDSTDVMGAASDTWVVSPRTVNDLRGQIALRNQIVRSLDPRCGNTCLNETDGGPTLEVTGVASIGRQRFTPSPRDNIRYQVVDSISHYRGSHELRAGFDVSYIQGRHQALPLHFGGRYIFQDISLPLVPGAAPVPLTAIQEVALGLPLAYVQGYGNSGRASNFADVSLFAQDTWRPSPSTTVSAGVRYQRQFWPSAVQQPAGYPGRYTFPSDNNNLAPRIAIAWRPRNSRTTSVQAGYGVYYDNIITSVFGIAKYINGGPDGLRTLVLRAPGSFVAWTAPAHRLSEAAAVQLIGGGYPSLAITMDPALNTPYAHRVSVGIERELPANMAFGAHLVYARGFEHLGTIDYNPVVPSLGPGRRQADVNGVAGTSASVLQYTSFGETWYRGLLLSLDKRARNASQIFISYTLSKTEDNSTDFQSAFLPQDNGRGRDPANPDGLPLGFRRYDERGPSLQDERHRLVVSGAQALPWGAQLSGIVTVASGRPYNILAGADLNGDGDGGSPSPDRARHDPLVPTSSVGRNSGRLPAQATVDVRLMRRVNLSSGVVAEPMIEVFNLFNRNNFVDVQNVFGTGSYPASPVATFGQFTKAGPPRQVQLALKVSF